MCAGGRGTALAELKWLQLLEDPPWGGRASNNGRAALLKVANKSQGTHHCGGHFLKAWECVNQRQLICKLTYQRQTFQMSIKSFNGPQSEKTKQLRRGSCTLKGKTWQSQFSKQKSFSSPLAPAFLLITSIRLLMHQAMWLV